jgi:hypothetical protein
MFRSVVLAVLLVQCCQAFQKVSSRWQTKSQLRASSRSLRMDMEPVEEKLNPRDEVTEPRSVLH